MEQVISTAYFAGSPMQKTERLTSSMQVLAIMNPEINTIVRVMHYQN